MPATNDKNRTATGTAMTQTTGKGMPAKTPRDGGARVGKQLTQVDASAEASLSLPHERDENKAMTNATPQPKIRQAKRDMDAGLQDTSNEPEMIVAYKKLK